MPLLQHLDVSINLRPVAESGQWHPALPRRRTRDCLSFPSLIVAMIVPQQRLGRSAKSNALGLRRYDTLRLPLTDIGMLVLRQPRTTLCNATLFLTGLLGAEATIHMPRLILECVDIQRVSPSPDTEKPGR